MYTLGLKVFVFFFPCGYQQKKKIERYCIREYIKEYISCFCSPEIYLRKIKPVYMKQNNSVHVLLNSVSHGEYKGVFDQKALRGKLVLCLVPLKVSRFCAGGENFIKQMYVSQWLNKADKMFTIRLQNKIC
jgi:hypothetical protein